MKIWMTLIALALIGSVLAEKPSLRFRQQEEYFRYEGAIMTSILNPKQSHSGTNLTMDITLTRSGEKTYFSFQNVKARTFNKEFMFAGELPPDSQQSPVQQLQGNFSVYLGRQHGVVMEVPQGEELWVTNIRKAIVSMFRIPPYTVDYQPEENMRSTDPIQRPSYTQRESTYAGRCNSSYTLAYDYANGTYPNTYQGYSFVFQGKQPTPQQPKFYRLRQSIDFESCVDAVHYTKTSVGNFSHVYRNQFKAVQSRSVIGQYLLIGIQNYTEQTGAFATYYIKGANLVSTQIVRPFGQDTGRIAVITNQTLYGVSQPFSRQQFSQQTQDVTSWMYQFASPASPSSSAPQPEWVIFQKKSDKLEPIYPEYSILGKHPQSQSQLKSYADSLLSQIPKLQQQPVAYNGKPFNGTSDGQLVERLKQLSQVIRALEKQQIQALFQSVPNGQSVEQKIKRQSFLDAAASSGSSAAMEVLLEAFKQQQIDVYRQAGLITVLVNNIHDPAAIEKLTDYVISIQPEQSLYLGTLSHLNLAMVLQRVCSQQQIKNYAVPQYILGVKACSQQVTQKFIQHLKSKIEGGSQEYEKMLYVQTLGRVGEPSTIQYLSQIVNDKQNQQQYSVLVRLAAVQALSRNFPQWTQRQQIIQSLLPVVQSSDESFEIRQAALINIIQQSPNASIYQILARQTWLESSYRMRGLLTSVFTTMAENDDNIEYPHTINIARKFLPMIQAVNPSHNHTGFFPFRDVLREFDIEIKSSFAWLEKYTSPYQPRQMYKSLTAVFGGIPVPLFKAFSILEGNQDMSNHQRSGNSRVPSNRRSHQEISQIAESLNIRMMQSSETQMYFILGSFNYEVFLPVNEQTVGKLLEALGSSLGRSPSKSNLFFFDMEHAVKYFNPVDVVSVLPTPFGLPSIIEVATPNNWYWGNKFTVFKLQGNTMNLTVDGINKMTMKAQSYATVLIPWSQQCSVAAYDTESSLSLPGKLSMVMNSTYPYIISKMVVSPQFTGERPVVYMRNKPFTAIRPMTPASDITVVNQLITPLANSSHSYNTSYWMSQEIFGIKGRLDYQGDVDFPINQRVLTEVISKPMRLVTLLTTPSQHDFTLALKLNMEQSETKNISIAGVLDMSALWVDNKWIRRDSPRMPTPEQIAEELSAQLSPETLVRKSLSGEIDRVVVSLGVNYTAPGRRNRQYLAVLTASDPKDTSSSIYKRDFVFNLMKRGQPSSNEEKKICLTVSLTEKRNQGSGIKGHFATSESTLYGGSKCSGSEKAITVESDYFLTTAIKTLTSTLRNSPIVVPQERRYDPAEVTAWKDDGYLDSIISKITVHQNAPRYLLNLTYIANDFMAGYAFPHLVVNRLPSQPQPNAQTIVEMKRSNYTGTFDTWISAPTFNAQVQQLPIAPLVDWLTPFIGPRIPLVHEGTKYLRTERKPGNKCIVKPESVISYDGVEYEKIASQCEEVATIVHHEQDSFVILASQPKLSSPHEKTTIKIQARGAQTVEIDSKWRVKVNGQEKVAQEIPIMSQDGRQRVGKIMNQTQALQVVMTNTLKVELLPRNNEYIITLPEKYRSLTKGLCGDFNQEKVDELMSPEGCTLTPSQGKIFAASWLKETSSCSDSQMQTYIQTYEQMKETCHKKK